MKQLYVLLGLWLMTLTAVGQNKPFRGHWYAGADAGIFSNKTRMIVGELSKYAAGGSGVMPLYGFKVGRIINPYISVETGVYSQPLNLVYQYEMNTATGAAPLRFLMFPIRANWRIQVLNDQLDAQVGVGLQYVLVQNQPNSQFFDGSIISRAHTRNDTLFYYGNVEMLRRQSINAEVSLGINWALSRRWTLSFYGRQVLGLANVAGVEINIRQNQEPIEKAEFVSRGSGFNLGFGLRYHFKGL